MGTRKKERRAWSLECALRCAWTKRHRIVTERHRPETENESRFPASIAPATVPVFRLALLARRLERPFVFLGQETEGGVGQESDGHNRVKETGAETENAGPVIVRLDAEAVVELQADADAGPVVGVTLSGKQADPVVAGHAEPGAELLLPRPGQGKQADQLVTASLRRSPPLIVLVEQDAHEMRHHRALVIVYRPGQAQDNVVPLACQAVRDALGILQDRALLHV